MGPEHGARQGDLRRVPGYVLRPGTSWEYTRAAADEQRGFNGPLIVGTINVATTPIVLAIGIINILVGAVGALFLRAPTRSSEDNLDKATSSREARCVEMCAAREASPESSAA